MKKKTIAALVQSHYEKNEAIFKETTLEIIKEFQELGDQELAEFLRAQIATSTGLTPQSIKTLPNKPIESEFFSQISTHTEPLVIPFEIENDLEGIKNAIANRRGVNKFLFYGKPGTGKTECVKWLAELLQRNLYIVNVPLLIDSKLGQTSKNIVEAFSSIKKSERIFDSIFLFDELDALALSRDDSNDLREMGRVTSTLLRCLDELSENAILFATTNLEEKIDSALKRRFDYLVSFDRYSKEDIEKVAFSVYEHFFVKYSDQQRDKSLFRKIITQFCLEYSPSKLFNTIKTAMAFSSQNDPKEHLWRLCKAVAGIQQEDVIFLSKAGFSLREIEIITKKSKSQIWRIIQEASDE